MSAAPSPDPAAAPAPVAGNRGRNAALTAIGQVFVLLGASLIGVVVAAKLSPGARLDAYFTASQITVAALYVGQTLRTSVPGLSAGGVVSIPVLARAAALMALAVGAVLLAGVALGPLLVTDASADAMRRDLLILLPGAVLQVGAGYAAGRLAMAGRFAGAALAYASGTLVNALLLVALIGDGAGVLAPTALAGWLLSASAIGLLLWRSSRAGELAGPPGPADPVPALDPAAITAGPPAIASTDAASGPDAPRGPATAAGPVGVLGACGRIMLSVTPVLGAQLVIVAAVTAATHLREGGSTIVSLAFLASNAVGTVAIAPIPIVLAADLASTWDRTTAALLPLIASVVRLSAAVTMPLVLGLFLVGEPIAGLALGGLSPADVDDLFTVLLIVLPSLPVTAASMVALVAVFALDRLGLVARYVSLAVVIAIASIVGLVAADASLAGLAVAGSIWSAMLGVATIAAAIGRAAPMAVALVFVQAASVALPSILVLAAALLSGTADALAPGLAWAAVGVTAHLAWLKLRYPAELAVLVGVVRR